MAPCRRTYDAGDLLVGKAHLTKTGWESTIPIEKLPLGDSACYIIAQARSGKKGEDSTGVDTKYLTTASVKKVSAKYKAARGKSSGPLDLSASIKSDPITQIVFGIDTNHDGKLDSGDEILYTGDGQSTKWKGAFDAIVGESYTVLAKVRDVNWVWSNTSVTSFEPS